jgi:hypothetical protein
MEKWKWKTRRKVQLMVGCKQGFAYRIFLPHSSGRIYFLAATRMQNVQNSLTERAKIPSTVRFSLVKFCSASLHRRPHHFYIPPHHTTPKKQK